jgi:hypothetical protein
MEWLADRTCEGNAAHRERFLNRYFFDTQSGGSPSPHCQGFGEPLLRGGFRNRSSTMGRACHCWLASAAMGEKGEADQSDFGPLPGPLRSSSVYLFPDRGVMDRTGCNDH